MQSDTPPPKANLFGLLSAYRGLVGLLIGLTIAANALSLIVPKIISHAIDTYSAGNFNLELILIEFFSVVFCVFLFAYGQNIMQTITAERVAKDLRTRLNIKIATQDYTYIERTTAAKLLTNLTSDADAVKTFVSQAVATIISSFFIIITTAVLLILINWKLALPVLCMIPVISLLFLFIFSRVSRLFKLSQENIDWLNKIITENILGAPLVRLLFSQHTEYDKFIAANTQSKEIGFKILRIFATLIPILLLTANAATLTILLLGGHYVILGTMSLGNFAAFNSYLIILIFPLITIGFMTNVIAQAAASYQRIFEVLSAPEQKDTGVLVADLRGDVSAEHVTLELDGRRVLKDVSFSIQGGQRTAIIGPTAAGKTQLLYLLIGLLKPQEGTIAYDGKDIDAYDKVSLHKQVGFVFQDSIIFNLSLRENIAFNSEATQEDINKAIATAELGDFISALPDGLNTMALERGTSLSGGQKQRIMLARALALNPKILLLDDFTARVDAQTERKILENIQKNYPDLTLISVTQKIAPIEEYDRIILLMEGEVLAIGTHKELMETSPEYVQIFESQRSTNTYELQA